MSGLCQLLRAESRRSTGTKASRLEKTLAGGGSFQEGVTFSLIRKKGQMAWGAGWGGPAAGTKAEAPASLLHFRNKGYA